MCNLPFEDPKAESAFDETLHEKWPRWPSSTVNFLETEKKHCTFGFKIYEKDW